MPWPDWRGMNRCSQKRVGVWHALCDHCRETRQTFFFIFSIHHHLISTCHIYVTTQTVKLFPYWNFLIWCCFWLILCIINFLCSDLKLLGGKLYGKCCFPCSHQGLWLSTGHPPFPLWMWVDEKLVINYSLFWQEPTQQWRKSEKYLVALHIIIVLLGKSDLQPPT